MTRSGMNTAQVPSSTGLHHSYEHTVECFAHSLVTLRAFIKTMRNRQRVPDSESLNRHEEAVEIFADSLVTLRALVRGQRAEQRLSERIAAQLLDQCHAAVAAARKGRAV